LLEAKAETSGPGKQIDSNRSHRSKYLVGLLLTAIILTTTCGVDRILRGCHYVIPVQAKGGKMIEQQDRANESE
jgi:hypothetical protein